MLSGPHLARVIVDIRGAATMVPEPPAARLRQLEEARLSFEQVAGRIELVLSDGMLLEQLAQLRSTVNALVSEVEGVIGQTSGAYHDHPPDRGRMAARMRPVEDRYREAMAEFDHFFGLVAQAGRYSANARSAAAAQAARVEVIVFSSLLAILGAASWLLWRLAKRTAAATEANERLISDLRESEARYRSIFDNAFEGIFLAAPDGRFLTVNKAMARMYGYKTPESLMEQLSDIGTQLYVEPGQQSALLGALQAEDVVSNFEFEVTRADGRTIWLRENIRAIRDGAGKLCYLEGSVEDVSDRWWAEQRRRLQYATMRALSESVTLAEARPRILQTICEIVDWDLGAVWDVDEERGELHCVEVWHAPDVDVREFEDANSNAKYPLGHGLAGEVWRTGEPRWIANLAELAPDASFPNANIALNAGMGSAYGIPIKVHGVVEYVLEFFSPHITLPDPELLQTLSAISGQLGHLIERKNAEEALRQSEVRKAAILQSALDCIVSYDAEGKIIEFNPAAERTFGRAQAAVLGRLVDEVILPEAQREKQRRLFGLDSEGSAARLSGRRFELTLSRGDGTAFPAEIALSRIVAGGRPMFTAYLRDVTERRNAERATAELAAVVTNSNDAIVGCTLDGVIRSWNAGAERMFGYSAEEVVGSSLHKLIPPDRSDEFGRTLGRVQRGESVANHETLRMRRDGKKFSVSVTDSPIRGEGGFITGLSSIVRDITERKRLEEQLLQAQKMEAVGRLAGGIAHDFNNVLTAIFGYSDLIIGQIDERHWMWKHLTEIRKAADFAASLTQQLLAFSRRQPLYPRLFCINDSVRSMERMLQRVIGEDIKVQIELDADIGMVKADPTQFEQVLLNLAVNARDAMPSGGVLTISTQEVSCFLNEVFPGSDMPGGEYVKLMVKDTGIGIPQEVMQHIFEPFFTTKEKGHGTGLGLATCYGIVKQSGGYITVDSAVGVGASFSIYLPRMASAEESAKPARELTELPGGNETILYVEDELRVRSLTADILRRLGYTVLEAGDGATARDLVRAYSGRKIDLLLADVVLPDLGVKDLSEWVLRSSHKTRVLFCSGYTDENVLKRHGVEYGRTFLQKPFTPAALAQKVREIIEDQE
jgi:PAS domain S-box-containing protein